MIVNDHLDEAAVRTKEKIQRLLALEGNPATLNTHYYADYKDKFIAYYKAARDDGDLAAVLCGGRQQSADLEYSVNIALAKLNEIGLSAKAIDLPKLLPADPKEPALNIIAGVRAYF